MHRQSKMSSGCAMLALALLSAPQSSTASGSPRQVIEEGSGKVQSILRQKVKKGTPAEDAQKKKLKTVVDGFLDYHELSRRALGPHWKDRSEQEKTEFVDLLRDLIEASYTGSIRDNIEYELQIDEEEIAEDGSTADVIGVASAKDKQGKPVSEDLTFHLYLKTGQWLIYDVEFGDISLVRHYRGEFNRKIKKESYAALLKVMREKLEDIRAGKIEKKIKL